MRTYNFQFVLRWHLEYKSRKGANTINTHLGFQPDFNKRCLIKYLRCLARKITANSRWNIFSSSWSECAMKIKSYKYLTERIVGIIEKVWTIIKHLSGMKDKDKYVVWYLKSANTIYITVPAWFWSLRKLLLVLKGSDAILAPRREGIQISFFFIGMELFLVDVEIEKRITFMWTMYVETCYCYYYFKVARKVFR